MISPGMAEGRHLDVGLLVWIVWDGGNERFGMSLHQGPEA